MHDSHEQSKTVVANSKDKIVFGTIISMAIIAFLSCALSPIFNFISNNYFVYNNGWDESTYLSYQGALAVLHRPGYNLPSALILALHKLGIAAVWQNVMFDLVIPPLVFFLGFKILRTLGASRAISAATIFALMGSNVLFFHDSFFGIFTSSIEKITTLKILTTKAHPLAILRSPNPQLSYLLIAISIWGYLKDNRKLWLVAPLPFLYESVGLPYLYFLCLYFLFRKTPRIPAWKIFLANILVITVISLFIKLTVSLYLSSNNYAQTFRFFHQNNHFIVTQTMIAGLIIIFAYLMALTSRKIKGHLITPWVFISGIMCLVFLANQHLISGVSLVPHNHEIYASVVIATGMLIYLIGIFDTNPFPSTKYFLIFGLSLMILPGILMRNGFNLKHFNFRIIVYPNISSSDIKKITKDPLHAIVPNVAAASRLVMLRPMMFALPFSHHYAGEMALCSKFWPFLKSAFKFAKKRKDHDPELRKYFPSIKERYLTFRHRVEQLNSASIKYSNTLCPPGIDGPHIFYIIKFTAPFRTRYFPDYR